MKKFNSEFLRGYMKNEQNRIKGKRTKETSEKKSFLKITLLILFDIIKIIAITAILTLAAAGTLAFIYPAPRGELLIVINDIVFNIKQS